jgi:hypothetical protein
MTAKDRVPDSERRRGGPTPAPSAAATSRPTAASAINPHLIPFLDLLGSLIADHILAEAAAGGAGKVALPPSPEPTIQPLQADPANSGPIPTVPADFQQASRSTPTKSRQPSRPSPPTRKDSHHASD